MKSSIKRHISTSWLSKKGYGKKVLTTLLNLVQENLKEGELFQVEATPTNGNREFYIKCGMKYKKENQDGVYIWQKNKMEVFLCIVKTVEKK